MADQGLRYKNISELRDAYAAGEISGPLWVDNDTTDAYVGDEKVFSAYPHEVLEEALNLLDIPSKHV